jgi:hypothetical protein
MSDNFFNLGGLIPLTTKGPQDDYMMNKKDDNLFNIKKNLLQDYHVLYHKIPIDLKWKSKNILNIIIKKNCDLINHLDLMFNKIVDINTTIKSIEVLIGGQRFDILNVLDLDTQIRTLCKIFNRSIKVINNKTFIPLIMAPFYDTNLIVPTLEYHEIIICIVFYEEQDKNIDINLYGNTYFLNIDNYKYIKNNGYEMITIQNQYLGEKNLIKGINSLNLYFNHPMYLIYLWGFDKAKVKNIKIEFNKINYYDGSIEALQNFQYNKELQEMDPLIIYFSQEKVGTPTISSVNFSRIDTAKIIIDTDEENCDIYIVGLNMQVVKFCNEMYGLVYSK